MKSWKIPTDDQVKQAVAHLVDKEHYRYFFYKLENPEWITPLSNKGYFAKDRAPQIQRHASKGTISFPPWPESNYLARMAKYKPDMVLKLMLPFVNAENISVHADLVDAALAMPPDLASKLVEKEIPWFMEQNQLYMILPQKIGSLAVHLAKGGKPKVALNLLNALLDPLPDSRSSKESTYPLEPRAKFESWDYGEVLKITLPELARACKLPALVFFCKLLEKAISLTRSNQSDDQAHQDYSYIWRPNIGHAREHSHDIENDLVSAVRDAARLIIEENLVSMEDVLSTLNEQSLEIFRRMELFLLELFSDKLPDVLTRRLMDNSLFDSFSMREEYIPLLNKGFKSLNFDQKQVILGWIEKGPNLVGFEKYTGDRPIDEAARKYSKQWQRDRLSWIKDDLPGDWKTRYQGLIDEFGEFQKVERNVSWTGPTSPKNINDLKQMSLDDILNFLEQWRPEEGWTVASPEGLGRVLTEVVKQEPERFINDALKFQNVHPTYIRALITGLAATLKEDRAFDWDPSLQLFLWAAKQPREISNKDLGFLKGSEPGWSCDPDWSGTRSTIARFFSEALSGNKITFDKRPIIWETITILTSDPDPTPERETKNGTSMEPSHMAINSTRGEAMQAVIQYALWIRRHIEKGPNKSKIKNGFNEMPEVRDILEQHLDPSIDPSYAIRSVYGKYLPWLQLLDPAWFNNNLSKIFPSGEGQHLYYDAAWQTYVTFCSPYDKVFEVLGDQYALAVSSINEPKKGGVGNPNEDVVEHLMVFYWRGKINLDDELLRKFWITASSELRGHAVEFVGRALYNDKTSIPTAMLERIKKIWVNQLSVAKSANSPAEYSIEMKAFGMWFASKQFDTNWALGQLTEALKIAGQVDSSHLVVEYLAELVTQMPIEVVNVLKLIVDGKEEWGIYAWRDTAKEILGKALLTSAKDEAEQLIHRLGRLGYSEFGELLR